MSSILETARQLNYLNIEFDRVKALPLPEPLHLINLTKKLNAVVAVHNDETPLGLEALKQKVKYAYNSQRISVLSRKDKIKFPFLLAWANEYKNDLCRQMLEEIKRIDSMQLLRREIYVYFNNYGNDNYIRELKKDILKKLMAYKKRNPLILSMKEHTYLFDDTQMGYVRAQCVDNNIFDFFSALHFPKSLLHSSYVGEVVKGVFETRFTKISLELKINLFKQIYDKLENELTSFLPSIYAALIIQVDAINGNKREYYIDCIRTKALAFMGDPRLGAGYFGRWHAAGEKAYNIFITWISQYDLDAFFKIIGDSLYDYSARNMWMYRERFWKSYKKHIQMVWVCYGTSAKHLAKRANMTSGNYSAFGQGNKSCILIVIGDYIFVERSHNGTLKVWKRNLSPFKIGEPNISEAKLNNSTGITHLENGIPKDGWVHSSSDTYNWQKKVGSFIAQYMHVIKTVKDW